MNYQYAGSQKWFDDGLRDAERKAREEYYATLKQNGVNVDKFVKDGEYSPFTAKMWEWRNAQDIPRRRFLYNKFYCRKKVSGTVAPGGGGKSSLGISEAVLMTAELGLVVWYWNLEEDAEELDRRIAAVCKEFKIPRSKIEGKLIVMSQADKLTVGVSQQKGSDIIVQPVVDNLVAEMLRMKVDVLMIDPFISCHHIGENDSDGMDAVVKAFLSVAVKTNASVMLFHHVRKSRSGDNGDTSSDDARGSSAFIDAIRLCRVLNFMTKDQATYYSIAVDDRMDYIRAERGKVNLVKRQVGKPKWYRLVSVSLENYDPGVTAEAWTDDIDDEKCDEVGVMIPWDGASEKPVMTTEDQVRDVCRALANPMPHQWRRDMRSKEDYVGRIVARVLNLDANKRADRDRMDGFVESWIRAGYLVEEPGKDRYRAACTVIRVGVPPGSGAEPSTPDLGQ